MNRNATSVMPMKVGTISSSRCRMKRSITPPGGRAPRAGARLSSVAASGGAVHSDPRYSALSTPTKRWMPTGSCAKPVTVLRIGMVAIEWAMVAQGACSLKTTCAWS